MPRRSCAEPSRTYYALGVRIRSTARLVQERLQGAEDRARYYRDILLPLRERIVHETQLHYNAMQLGVFELLRAREQQIQAAVAYVDTLLDYWLARTDLEQLLSGRLPSADGVTTGRRAAAPNDGVRTQDINKKGSTMAENMSRRQMFGLTAAAVGGVTAWARQAHRPARPSIQEHYRPCGWLRRDTEHERPYWEASYSGGPVDVKPLPPGRPGKRLSSPSWSRRATRCR